MLKSDNSVRVKRGKIHSWCSFSYFIWLWLSWGFKMLENEKLGERWRRPSKISRCIYWGIFCWLLQYCWVKRGYVLFDLNSFWRKLKGRQSFDCTDKYYAGWTPQTFTSSRKNRADVTKQNIYSFLDDEDIKVCFFFFW